MRIRQWTGFQLDGGDGEIFRRRGGGRAQADDVVRDGVSISDPLGFGDAGLVGLEFDEGELVRKKAAAEALEDDFRGRRALDDDGHAEVGDVVEQSWADKLQGLCGGSVVTIRGVPLFFQTSEFGFLLFIEEVEVAETRIGRLKKTADGLQSGEKCLGEEFLLGGIGLGFELIKRLGEGLQLSGALGETLAEVGVGLGFP